MKKTVAIVEDNPDNRLLFSAILGDRYAILEFEDGITALAALPKALPDLILMDISLPEMDGPEVLARIRSDDDLRSIPVIALTAHAMSGDRERLLGLGFDDYVSKPIVDEDVLVRAIESLLAR